MIVLIRINQNYYQSMQTLLAKFLKSNGVSIDTRTLQPGQIFFAIKGDSFDGNLFAFRAIEKGAALAVVDDPSVCFDERYYLVNDVLKSLQELAGEYRNTLKIQFLAITGTNGKTTTKELIASVLSQKFNILATEGNFNNHLGVPLTLLRIKPDHQLAIIEMGASGKGEIGLLCSIAKPDIGLITNVGAAHLEGFGSVEGVMEAKSELFRYLDANGGKVLFPESLHDKKYFTSLSKSDWIAYKAEQMNGTSVLSVKLTESFPYNELEILTNAGEKFRVPTRLYGSYNFANLVNAIKVGDYFNLTPEMIATGIGEYQPKNNRSQLVKGRSGNEIIMDAYNANPSSMSEALKHFKSVVHKGEKMLILGDMLELGKDSIASHEQVLKQLVAMEDMEAICIGKEFDAAKKALGIASQHIHFFGDTIQAKDFYEKLNVKNRLILVKGSRGIALEKIFPDIFSVYKS